jgi:folate-binding protein YgfZ
VGAVLIERDEVMVEGADATTFLQGQLSADLHDIDEGTAAWALLLEPTGKMGWLLRVTRVLEDVWLLDVEAGQGERVRERLARFLLRVHVELRQRAQPSVVVRGPGAAGIAGSVGTWTHDPGWPGVEGVDLLGADTIPEGIAAATAADLEALRIWCGVPAHGAEITDETIPGELGKHLVNATVSFTKGCYTGQELVARIDSRGGNVPRPIRRLRPEAPVSAGAPLFVGDDEVGRVTSAASHRDLGEVALGALARRVGIGADDVVAVTEGGRVRVEVLDDVDAGAS